MNRKGLPVLFPVALSVRLTSRVFILHHPGRAFDNNSVLYVRLGEIILVSATIPNILRAPGYKLFITSSDTFFGKFPQAVPVFHHVLDSVTAVIIALLFYRIFHNAKHSSIAGFLCAINPFAVFYSNRILTLIVYFSFIPGIVGYGRFRVPILPSISIFSASGVRTILVLTRSGK